MPAGLLSAVNSWSTWAADRSARAPWELAVSLKVPITAPEALDLLNVPGLADAEGTLSGYGVLGHEGAAPVDTRVVGLPVPSRLQTLELTGGSGFSSPDAEESIVNVSFSRGRRRPAVGEYITLSMQDRQARVKVVGLVSDASLQTVYIPLKLAQRLLNQPEKFSTIYFTRGQRADSELYRVARAAVPEVAAPARPGNAERIELDDEPGPPTAPSSGEQAAPTDPTQRLLAYDIVSSVQSRREMGTAMLGYVESFRVIAIPFIGLGALLSFLFVLCVLALVFSEREVEYATLQCFGYGGRRITTLIYSEVATLSALGLLLSLFTWQGMTHLLQAIMAYAWFWVPVDLAAADLLLVVVPTLVCLLAAAAPSVVAVLRMNLASTLRARGVG
jgi:hypothetical protein